SMLLFVLHALWSIIDDSGSVVSSVVSSHPAPLSFHMLAGNLDRAQLRRWRTPKGQQPCLLRMQSQSEAPQPFLQHRQHPSCILLSLKADDEVVTIADQDCFPPQPWLHFGFKPAVQHIVQIDVAQ